MHKKDHKIGYVLKIVTRYNVLNPCGTRSVFRIKFNIKIETRFFKG